MTFFKMAAIHGSMSQFDKKSDDWRSYLERFNHYCSANGVADDKKRAVLFSVCGAQMYNLIRGIVSTDESFDVIVAAVTKHCSPPPSSIVQRFRFNTRIRATNESVADYVAVVRQLTEFCEFGDTVDNMIRDRLVCGINDDRIQRRLLAEPKLDFAKALQLALAMESAALDSKKLSISAPAQPVYYESSPSTSNAPRQPSTAPSSRFSVVCWRCGGQHYAPSCKFREAVCNFCKKRGHIAKVCRSRSGSSSLGSAQRPKATVPSTNYVEVEASESEQEGDTFDSSYSLFTISDRTSEPFTAKVSINDVDLLMEIDTGASLSILSGAKYQELLQKGAQLPLEPSQVSLKTYTGESLNVLGSIRATVKFEGQVNELSLLVVVGNGPALLGRNWMSKFKVTPSIFHVAVPDRLEQLLDKFAPVFGSDLGCLKGIEAKVYVDPQVKPKFFKPRSVPYMWKEKIEVELQRMVKQGILTPVKFSQWAAPIVPVCKEDGSIRLCGDYKVTINQALKMESYPLPRIDDIFAALEGGVKFTKLDLSQAYLQLPMEEASKEFLTINTHKGLFQFNRLPFGVSTAPAIFQRAMDSLLQGLKGVSVYIDDILVTGSSIEDHLHDLEVVLGKLNEAGLKLKRSKCVFLAESVQYLGYIIDQQGLRPMEEKVQAIKEAPSPGNITELRAFLGILNYYSKFLPNLATVLAPLYKLLHKDTKWFWGEEQRQAFQEAKEMLQSDALLVHYSSEKKLLLACDASPYGIGAVHSHIDDNNVERPASRSLTKAEKAYSQLDKEALAIVFGVKKFHSYLVGRSFVIQSDHQPLYHLFHQNKPIPPMASARLQRWALTLSAYQYQIHYKPGKQLSNADALSRLPRPLSTSSDRLPGELVQLLNFVSSTQLSVENIKLWTSRDPLLSRVKTFVTSGWSMIATFDLSFLDKRN